MVFPWRNSEHTVKAQFVLSLCDAHVSAAEWIMNYSHIRAVQTEMPQKHRTISQS